MKKLMVFAVSMLALVSFTVFASAQTEKNQGTKKSQDSSAEMVKGKIVSLDPAKNEIVIKEMKTGVDKTITASSEIISSLKVGEEVKATLKAGTNNAERVKKEVKKYATGKKTEKK